ncbi:MAG: response regulator [Candidatus Binatia bacterium]|nr:response regulator [Candidatus Binatia bacterium]
MGSSSELDYRKFPTLVVGDEPDILASFRLAFRREFTVYCAAGGAAGLEILEKEPTAVVVADQRMPDMNGLEFLQKTMDARPDLVRIILTGYTDIDTLVEAINSSRIYRYITKPWDPKELQITLRRAIETFGLEHESARLVAELAQANERLSGENAYRRDRGTRDHPCGLVSSGEPMAKLLGVLQENEITPVGETRPRKIDTRVVASTSRNLETEVAEGRFREDLYCRLRVVPVRVPPLRERSEDIPDLVDHFIEKHAARLGKRVAGIEPEAMKVLTNYPYPGNVRELENEMERGPSVGSWRADLRRIALRVLPERSGARVDDDLPADRRRGRRGRSARPDRCVRAQRDPSHPRPERGEEGARCARARDHVPGPPEEKRPLGMME